MSDSIEQPEPEADSTVESEPSDAGQVAGQAEPEAIEPEAIVSACKRWLALGVDPYIIRRRLTKKFGEPVGQQAERWIGRAREEMIAKLDVPRQERIAEAIWFYQYIISHPKSTIAQKLRARTRIDQLNGDIPTRTPAPAPGSPPPGSYGRFSHESQSVCGYESGSASGDWGGVASSSHSADSWSNAASGSMDQSASSSDAGVEYNRGSEPERNDACRGEESATPSVSSRDTVSPGAAAYGGTSGGSEGSGGGGGYSSMPHRQRGYDASLSMQSDDDLEGVYRRLTAQFVAAEAAKRARKASVAAQSKAGVSSRGGAPASTSSGMVAVQESAMSPNPAAQERAPP
ncbi:MAG: hypothetical protein JJU36_11805 [Phycisphaeraceae bacterium]|nr:hypothetical protein [Phycisphaeraceae bacterium]